MTLNINKMYQIKEDLIDDGYAYQLNNDNLKWDKFLTPRPKYIPYLFSNFNIPEEKIEYETELLNATLLISFNEMNEAVTFSKDLLSEEIHFMHIFDFLSNHKFLSFSPR